MADNYAENKNNTVFAFCSELILRGWFDEVQLLFGPVGHTHNGNDAVHYTHNQVAGNQVSVTLAEFFTAFDKAWINESARPQPVILDELYDWDQYYKEHIQEVACFSKTRNCQSYVRAFRFVRSEYGLVEMTVKGSPSAPKWCGQKGIEDGPGFVILRSLPRKAPPRVTSMECSLAPRLLADLKGKKLKDFCVLSGYGDSHQWLVDFASTGNVPIRQVVDPLNRKQHHLLDGWDVVKEIGTDRCAMQVPFLVVIPGVKEAIDLWDLPMEVVHFQVPEQKVVPDVTLPMVRYKHERPPDKSPDKESQTRKRVTSESSEDEEQPDDKPENDSDSEASVASWRSEDANLVTTWGAHDKGCQPGSFAVVEVIYGDKDIGFERGVTTIEVDMRFLLTP